MFSGNSVWYYRTLYSECFMFYKIIRARIPSRLSSREYGHDISHSQVKFMLNEPDESSCSQMASSLRTMLAMDFAYVDNVHSKKKESMSAEFRKIVDKSWNWLGKSLLLPTSATRG